MERDEGQKKTISATAGCEIPSRARIRDRHYIDIKDQDRERPKINLSQRLNLAPNLPQSVSIQTPCIEKRFGRVSDEPFCIDRY